MNKKTIHKIAGLNAELAIALRSDDIEKINYLKVEIRKILFDKFWGSLKGGIK